MKRYQLVSPNGADRVEVLEGLESDVARYKAAGWREVEKEAAPPAAVELPAPELYTSDPMIVPRAWDGAVNLDKPSKQKK